jgi:chromosome transmission fidelity protein 1
MYLYHDTVIYFQLNELGRILINVCNVVPAGVVCFFPSYEYENTVYEHWKKNEIISKIELKKKVSFMLLSSVKYSVV